jgi:two-component sensor histidine kinase
MTPIGPPFGKALRQQAVISAFGSFAIRESDLLKILTEAARVCAEGLSLAFCKGGRYRPAGNAPLVEAGYGWHDVHASVTGAPASGNDLGEDNECVLPPFPAEHGFASAMGRAVAGSDNPCRAPGSGNGGFQRDCGQNCGVRESDSNMRRHYDQHDIDFLIGFANVLAAAVATSSRAPVPTASVGEKDRPLEPKEVMAADLRHLVRNNLQLICGMLGRQFDDTANEAGQRGIRSIALRVTTLAQVYGHLRGTGMACTANFGSYVQALCRNLASIHATPMGTVMLACDGERVILGLDTVAALGIVVAELVTNCYDHAFCDTGSPGTISVSVYHDREDASAATMTVSDNGHGFEPAAGNKRQGIGMVQRLVEQISGTAAVKSGHGGTLWTVRFPAPEAAVA